MSRRSLFPSLWSSDEASKDVFGNLQNEVDRVFHQFRDFLPTHERGLLASSNGNGNGSMQLLPPIDISESEGAIDIDVELPGVEKNDIDVSMVNQTLIVEGSKQSESEKEGKNWHRVERMQGAFRRQIPLGFETEVKNVSANFKNGVLHLCVKKPKEVKAKTKKIEVKETETA